MKNTSIVIGPLSFSAAHIVHLADKDSKCQRLHGHNYAVLINLEGPIQSDGMLVDAHHIKDIINTLDHKTLVPKNLIVESTVDIANGFTGYIMFKNPTNNHTYELPEEDCAILKIKTTSAEHLADWINKTINKKHGDYLTTIKVRVWETHLLNATSEVDQ